MSVLAKVAAKSPAWALALAGSESRGRRWGPCPACGADDRRGPVLCGDRAWTCVRCGVSASALRTVALLAGTEVWSDVALWVEQQGVVQVDDLEVARPSVDVEVRGKVPRETYAALAWAAVAAGLELEQACGGAAWLVVSREAAREQARTTARRLWDAAKVERCADARLTLRRTAVQVWAAGAYTDEVWTVPRTLARS